MMTPRSINENFAADSLLQSEVSFQAPPAQEEEQFYARCRRAMLRLSASILQAAEHRSDFAPFLLEAMHNAMTQLLEHGDESELLLLEQWLDEDEEVASHHTAHNRSGTRTLSATR